MINKKGIIIGAVITGAVLLTAGIFGYRAFLRNQTDITQTQSTADSGNEDTSYMHVTYDGTNYDYNTDLKNIVFLGIDKKDVIQTQRAGAAGQSDCVILLSMDTKNKTTKLLQISRDAMTELRVYGIDGGFVGTQYGQLALQYSYGDGKKKSALITKDTVSNLLYGIPIRSYFALDIDGIAPAINALGGLTVTFDEDWTWIDPAFQKGATLTMDGDQTTKFVRSRDTSLLESNTDRMNRQTLFLRAFISQVQKKSGGSETLIKTMLSAAGDYLVTDIQDDEIYSMTNYDVSNEVQSVPGQIVMGEKYAEFNVDKTGLYKILLEMLYKPESR